MSFKKILHKQLKQVVGYSKKITFPGFNKASLYDVLKFLFDSIINGDILNRSASMAFSFFLALFPAIIFLFSLIPYIPVDDFQANLLLQIQLVLPGPAYVFAQQTIEELVTNSRLDLLSFGFLASIFFASNGVNAMIDNFNNSIHVVKRRSILSMRLTSIYLIFMLGTLIIISIVLLLFGTKIISLLGSYDLIQPATKIMLLFVNWIITIGFIYFSVSFFYYYGPNKRSRWRFLSAGSSLATFLIISVSVIFGEYVNQFGTYNKIYGSIGAMMVILLWIYFNCVVLILGFELNVSLKKVNSITLN
ncbi:MAG: YihY/virulence factor BrkB family protein [Flavobacteriales bacterium]|nr:YihY/virulence factor BrkB family protein [Flavobacteriales bacterium]